MDRDAPHGPRISGREFERRVSSLHLGSSSETREERARVQRQEFELRVARRLGTEFPPARLEELWRVACRVERRRYRMLFWWLVDRIRPGSLDAASGRLPGYLAREFGEVLSEAELNDFLADDVGDE